LDVNTRVPQASVGSAMQVGAVKRSPPPPPLD
jgi:hypothetical protein